MPCRTAPGLMLVLCLLLFPAAPVARAQSPGPAASAPAAPTPVSISQALADVNRDGVLDLLNQRVVLTGVVTYEPRVIGQSATTGVIQDDSAAIWLFSTDPRRLVPTVRRGDRLEVTGQISQYRGRSQVTLTGVRHLGAGTLPAPRDVTVASLLRPGHACELVRVRGRIVTVPSQFGRKLGLLMDDGTGRIPVLLTDYFLQDFAFLEHLVQSRSVTLTGIPTVDIGVSPESGDYRLTPRDPGDFVFPMLIPYRGIAFVSTGVAVLGAVVTLWLRRQNAERRARELADLNARLREAKEAAEAASRAKSQFLATMSHEIRTPMNGVIAMTGLLLDSPLNADQRECAETIQGSADALMAIINDVLDFSKIEAGRIELDAAPFDLQVLLEEVADLLAPRAERKGIHMVVRWTPGTPRALVGDAGRIRQVLVNLVGNAVKFTEHGEVVIAARPEDGAGASQARVAVAVEDTGIGIPADQIDRMFERFTQADTSTTRRYGGTGLGLAISRQLAELMGGRLTAASRLGEGTTLTLHLALPTAPDAGRPAGLPPALQGATILVLDRHATRRLALVEQLQALGLVPVGPEVRPPRDAASPPPASLAVVEAEALTDHEAAAWLPSRAGFPIVALAARGNGHPPPGSTNGATVWLYTPVRWSQLPSALGRAWALGHARETPRDGAPPPLGGAGGTVGSAGNGAVLAPFEHLRVLVVEDNRVNQRVATKVLERLGCEVEVADEGRQAIERLSAASYDLVLMDCQMPVMDGYAATAAIRALGTPASAVPIIAMTAHALPGDRERCLAAGMNDYVTKPIKPAQLQDVVGRLAAGLPGRRSPDGARAKAGSE